MAEWGEDLKLDKLDDSDKGAKKMTTLKTQKTIADRDPLKKVPEPRSRTQLQSLENSIETSMSKKSETGHDAYGYREQRTFKNRVPSASPDPRTNRRLTSAFKGSERFKSVES